MSPLWILKKKNELGYFLQKWLNLCKTGFGEISFFVSHRTEINVHYKFCNNEQIFFTCKYCK